MQDEVTEDKTKKRLRKIITLYFRSHQETKKRFNIKPHLLYFVQLQESPNIFSMGAVRVSSMK